jgi:NADH dehydrogenase
MSSKTATKKHLIIVGGGFAGVRLARKLQKRADLEITLISERTYFAYYPQLYHTATGGDDAESALDLAGLFSGTRVTVLHDSLTEIDSKAQSVKLASETTLPYDYLALAMGVVTNYFGIKGMEEHSFNIKSIEGAKKFKQHLHQEILEHKKLDKNYVIAGAGPTGVEMAGALGEYLERIAKQHKLGQHQASIDLVEAAPRILPRSSEAVSKRVQKRLEKLGVNVMTAATVEGETAKELKLKGSSVPTESVVWTAGVSNHPFFAAHSELFQLNPKGGRVMVDEHLEAVKNIYVLGDNASTLYGGLAQTAVSDANFVARDLVLRLDNTTRLRYKPKKPITVTPVGSHWAVAEYGKLHVYGMVGWFLRRVADLIAYRDVEPLPKALKVWSRDRAREDDCPICAKTAG